MPKSTDKRKENCKNNENLTKKLKVTFGVIFIIKLFTVTYKLNKKMIQLIKNIKLPKHNTTTIPQKPANLNQGSILRQISHCMWGNQE